MKNYDEFLKAKELIKQRMYKEAEEILRNLHLLEPEVNVLKFELAKFLTRNKNTLTEGKKLYEELLNTNNKSYAMLELIFLEINNRHYKQAYSLFNELSKEEILKKEYEHIKFYLEYKLGILPKSDKKINGYFYNQLTNYNENDTINHIKLHLDENGKKCEHTLYADGLNIDMLYSDIKIKIQNMNPNLFSLTDKYIIDYDYVIASVNGIDTNKIKVITFSNTKDIITMYPIISEKLVVESKPKVKEIKRESRIDKFNIKK